MALGDMGHHAGSGPRGPARSHVLNMNIPMVAIGLGDPLALCSWQSDSCGQCRAGNLACRECVVKFPGIGCPSPLPPLPATSGSND